jgi:hypothetical protein
MQWKSDLESLVEQTKAMVKNANLKSAELAQANPTPPLRESSAEIALSRTAAASPSRVTAVGPPRVTADSPPHVTATSPPRVAATFPPRVTAASPPHATAVSREREEIRLRVAGFKAHQEKLRREREQYYLEMTAKVRAMLRNGIQDGK